MAELDVDAVAAEIRVAFDAYEAALQANDVAALTAFFWEDPRALRMATEGGIYGHAEIAAFRREREVHDLARELTRVEVVAAEYRRRESGRRGAQSQIWVRRPEGWSIAAAHVSLER